MGTARSSSSLDNILGLLRVRVVRGTNLAIRDLCSSDPYVVLKLGEQKLKTHVIKNNVNPEWNEELTFSVNDPNSPIKLCVFDHDTFTPDDPMGDAEIDIKHIADAARNLEGIPKDPILKIIKPDDRNCLSADSSIIWSDGKVVQNICLRLNHTECGEVELQLQWINLNRSRVG